MAGGTSHKRMFERLMLCDYAVADHATRLELAVLAKDEEEAANALIDALAVVREA